MVVLLKLLDPAEPPPVRDLARGLGFDVAGTHRAMRRLGEAGLYSEERRRVHEPHAEEFLVHAVKFSFPAKLGSEVPGVPTSWATDPLKGELADYPGLPVVWPCAMGRVRGLVDRDRDYGETIKDGKPICLKASWGNKWGNMPHRFQPVPAGLDLPETA